MATVERITVEGLLHRVVSAVCTERCGDVQVVYDVMRLAWAVWHGDKRYTIQDDELGMDVLVEMLRSIHAGRAPDREDDA